MRGSTAGFTGTLSGLPHIDSPLLQWADVLFSCAVITPASIAYWKSTWSLMDLYIYPEDPFMNAVTCTVFGLCFSVLLCLFQSQFKKYIHPDRGRVVYYVVSRLYSVVAGVTCIGAFKGVWDLADQGLGESVWSVWWTTVAAVLALAAMRSLRNICATPFVIVLDSPRDYFDVPTFFRTSTRETVFFVLDCVFSVAVVGCLVITVWRGLWAMGGMVFFPEHSLNSLMMSLVFGYALTILAFALQSPMQWAASRLGGAPKLLLGDLYNLVAFAATISVWRAFWILMDDYLFPDSPELSNWTSHLISLMILMLLNCFNSVLVRGVYFDNEDPAEECMVFPCHYIRIYYYRRKMRKKFRTGIASDEKNKLADSSVPLQIDIQK